MFNQTGNDNIYTMTYTPTTTNTAAIWSYSFAIINAANGFLENIAPVNNIPAATKSEMIAEAKFYGHSAIQSYCYIMVI